MLKEISNDAIGGLRMSDSNDQQGRIGQHCGGYILSKYLGDGCFGEVYLGEDKNGEQVAIKFLHTQLTEQKDKDAFYREARIASKVCHKNIVRVKEFDIKEDGTPFLIMDYEPHGTLRKIHPRGSRINLETIVIYVQQVAHALQVAHAQGIIHRDVKPENMLRGPIDEVLLSDFGNAINDKEIPHNSHPNCKSSESRIYGDPVYMAPEQFEHEYRPASDQYALAVVVYEWLCGRPPFEGSFEKLFHQHRIEPQPPPPFDPSLGIPRSVENVVMKALAKNPRKRFKHVRDFAKALARASSRVVEHEPTTNYLYSSGLWSELMSRRGAIVSLAIALTGVTLAGLAVEVGLRESPPKVPAAHEPGWIYTYRGHQAKVRTVAWSSNGLIASGDDGGEVHVWDIHGKTWSIYREHQDRVTGLSFFPDGESIASVSLDGTLRMWHGRTGINILEPYPNPAIPFSMFAVVWSPAQGNPPTSEHLMLNIRFDVLIFDNPLQPEFRYAQQDPTYKGHDDNVNSLAWLPDPTKKIVASASDDGTVQVWEVYTGKRLVYPGHNGYDVLAVAWSPDGKLIASGGSDQTVQVWDAATGSPYFVKQGLPGAVNAVVWIPSNRGRYVVWATADGSVEVWDVDKNKQVFAYRGHIGSVNTLTTSPDGLVASGGYDKTVQVWKL